VPGFRVALELLFQHRGLLSLSPILALAAVGGVALWRRGLRAETIVVAAVFAAYVVYDSGDYLPFGSASPGPRFLIVVIPFLAVPAAAGFARYPLHALALAVASIRHGAVVGTALPWDGIAGFVPVVALVAAALALAPRSMPTPRVTLPRVEAAAAVWIWFAVMVYAARVV